MELNERILYNAKHQILVNDKSSTKWSLKQILISQNSLMIFGAYNSVFEFCDCKSKKNFLLKISKGKILISNHEAFTVSRKKFVEKSLFNQKAIGTLDHSFKFITIFLNMDNRSFRLIASSLEEKAKELTRSIKVANCYQSLRSTAKSMGEDLDDFYIEWFVQSSIHKKLFFEIDQRLLRDRDHVMFLKQIFSTRGIVRSVRVKNVNFDESLQELNTLMYSMDDDELQELEIIDCNLEDFHLDEINSVITHHKLLKHFRISGTNLTNRAFLYFSKIWDDIPFLESFHLNNSIKITGTEFLDEFLISIFEKLKLKILDLSHNNLLEKATDIITSILLKKDYSDYFGNGPSWLKEINFSYNTFTLKENYTMFKIFEKSSLNSYEVHFNIQPYPIYSPLIETIVGNDQKVVLAFERAKISVKKKRQLLTSYDMEKVKELSEEISTAILMQKTIEGISQLCDRIQKLDFEFPPQYIEKLRELVREVIQNSFETEDFYSFEHAKKAAIELGISKRELLYVENGLRNKADKFAMEVERLFNLNLPETKINLLMDELVTSAIYKDLRGPAVDLLFYLKEKRDETANFLMKKKKGKREVELEIMEMDPYFILAHNEEFAEQTKNLDNDDQTKDMLGLHPRWVNYESVSKLTRNYLFECANQTISDENNEIKTFKIKRALFILSEPSTEIYTSNKSDKLLRISRTICRYRWFKGSSGLQSDNVIRKIELLMTKMARIDEIEKERIQTARQFIKTERDILHLSKSDSTRGIRFEKDPIIKHIKRVREKELQTINHPMDSLHGVSSASIQKVPMNLDLDEYSLGLTINAYIFKICNLKLDKLSSTMFDLIKKFIGIGRGVERLEKGNGKIKTEFIVGEIFLNLIKFINTNRENPKRNLIKNAFNLLALISYFLKMEKDIAFYAIYQFYNLVYLKLEEENFDSDSNLIKSQSLVFFSNVIDTLESKKFFELNGLRLPEDEVLLNLFKGNIDLLEFNVTITACKKIRETVKCRKDKFVYEFIRDLLDVRELYDDHSMEKYGFWLFLLTEDPNFEDIPLDYDWTMRRVHHLQIYTDSDENSRFKKLNKSTLIFKLRIHTIRQKFFLDMLTKTMLYCLFHETRYNYLNKHYFTNVCKIDTIVEIASILHIISQNKESDEYNEIFIDSKFEIENIIPRTSIHLLSKSEWKRKIDLFLGKNAYLKKQSMTNLKRKMMSHLVHCPSFTSRVYQYKLKGEGSPDLRNEGSLSINIFGIFFFQFSDFSKTTLHLNLEEIVNVTNKMDSVLIEYMREDEHDPQKLELMSPLSEDILNDILAYMLVGLREKRRLFYSYVYLSSYIKLNKDLTSMNLDPVTHNQIEKCISEIKRLREYNINLKNMPYTKEYNENIKDQNKEKVNQITLGGGFSIQSKRSFRNQIDILKMTGLIRQNSMSDEGFSRQNSQHFNRSDTGFKTKFQRATKKVRSQNDIAKLLNSSESLRRNSGLFLKKSTERDVNMTKRSQKETSSRLSLSHSNTKVEDDFELSTSKPEENSEIRRSQTPTHSSNKRLTLDLSKLTNSKNNKNIFEEIKEEASEEDF